ncbi:MAG: hypothetical protein J3K34DRAFT_442606 [Monoraphidium minutum]|nr:MAG: hypothetical protein J3K34DRAFT_442606 [Monoraphidium minutum]
MWSPTASTCMAVVPLLPCSAAVVAGVPDRLPGTSWTGAAPACTCHRSRVRHAPPCGCCCCSCCCGGWCGSHGWDAASLPPKE